MDYVVLLYFTNGRSLITKIPLVGKRDWLTNEEVVFVYLTSNGITNYRLLDVLQDEFDVDYVVGKVGVNLSHIVEIKFIEVK